MKSKKSAAERFYSKFLVTPGCWIWKFGKTTGGYGQFYDGENRHRSHRFSWQFYYGEIPPGLCVCHKCDNRACVNPDHLFLATNEENSKDRSRKGRSARTRGERNGASKLTEADVLKIRASTLSHSKIAKIFGINATNVFYIKKRKTWSHV